MVACIFFFSINRYRGLSGNHGNSISWIAVGIMMRDSSRGQYCSCMGKDRQELGPMNCDTCQHVYHVTEIHLTHYNQETLNNKIT